MCVSAAERRCFGTVDTKSTEDIVRVAACTQDGGWGKSQEAQKGLHCDFSDAEKNVEADALSF